MDEVINELNPIREQKSSIKLSKNSKGYTWEIKVYLDDVDMILPKVNELNLRLKEQYEEAE